MLLLPGTTLLHLMQRNINLVFKSIGVAEFAGKLAGVRLELPAVLMPNTRLKVDVGPTMKLQREKQFE